MPTEFSSEVRVEGETAVLDLHGDVDRSAGELLDAAFDQAAATSSTVLLDFSDVDYINSTGIAVIVGVLARGRAAGKQVWACGLSDHYQEIFEITRLSDFMTIYADEDAALAATR